MFATIILIIFVFLLLFILFYLFSPALGSKPNKEERREYKKRASNYIDDKFTNLDVFKLIDNNVTDKNEFISRKGKKPKDEIPVKKPLNHANDSDLIITWLGHSSVFLKLGKLNVLFDPIFSNYASPIKYLAPKRFSKNPVKIEDLPNIDIVIITQDHYDHLDYDTIKKLDEKVCKYVVPLGVETDLKTWKINPNKIITMAWWEEITINGLLIACTPGRHYSGRMINDKFSTLWCSFVLKNDRYQIFESGDTGYGKHFEEIHKKYGDFDLALLDSGQYDVKWKYTHMNPNEAIKAGKDLNAKVIMPIHYGAFKLARHPWDEPVVCFVKNAKEQNVEYLTPMIGETINFKNYKSYKNEWWKNIK